MKLFWETRTGYGIVEAADYKSACEKMFETVGRDNITSYRVIGDDLFFEHQDVKANILYYSEKLTLLAQNLFGKDIVRKAYYADDDNGGIRKYKIDPNLISVEDEGIEPTDDRIVYPENNDIAIEFTSGKLLFFGSVDFGTIESLDEHDVVVDVDVENNRLKMR